MVHTAHIDLYHTFADFHIGNMLLNTGIHTTGNQSLHLLAAAKGFYTGVTYHLYDIATMGTNIKSCILHVVFLRLFEVVFVFLYGLILAEEYIAYRDFLT
jgi:hypothetical protein